MSAFEAYTYVRESLDGLRATQKSDPTVRIAAELAKAMKALEAVEALLPAETAAPPPALAAARLVAPGLALTDVVYPTSVRHNSSRS